MEVNLPSERLLHAARPPYASDDLTVESLPQQSGLRESRHVVTGVLYDFGEWHPIEALLVKCRNF
jgi:hypothetical protein